MVVFNVADLLAETEGSGDFQLHFRPVFRVPAPALRLPECGHGEGIVPYQLFNVLPDTAFIAVFLGFKFSAYLIAELEMHPGVHHRLAFEHIPVVLHGNVDICKYLPIRLPVEFGAGLFPVGRLLFQAALVSSLLKVQIIPKSVPADGGVKIFGSVLGGAGAKAI